MPALTAPPCSKGEGPSPRRPLLFLSERKKGMCEAGEDLTLLPCPWIVYYYYFGVSFVN